MHSHIYHTFLAILLCTSSAASQSRGVVRDSASVRIVEHRTIKGLPAVFRIEATPIRSLGGLQSDLRAEFPAQTGGTWHRLADGRILVDGLRELKIFDDAGKLLRTIGRQGSGPGEFVQNYMSNTCVTRGDTIMTFETGRAVVNVFDGTGKFVRELVLDRFPSQTPGAVCFSDATFLTYATLPPTAPGQTTAASASGEPLALYRRFRSDNSIADTIGIFSREAQVAIRDSILLLGSYSSPVFRLYTWNGRLTTIVRWNDPLEPLPARAATGGGPARGAANAGSGRAAAPPSRPTRTTVLPYGSVYMDKAGRIWLRDASGGSTPPQGWTVFLRNGELLGRVRTPTLSATMTTAMSIIALDGNDVVLRWTDDDGVHITTHRLTPP